VRAETAAQFDSPFKLVNGEVNKFVHLRDPIPVDKQTVIRMNRDTLYSAAMVVNKDHFVNKVYHEPGTHKMTMEEFDTLM
jgi:hypothetical protein